MKKTREMSSMAASKRPRLTAAAVSAVMLMVLAAPAQGVRIPEGGIVSPDSTSVIHFQVYEGCDGSPTDMLEVTIPESVRNPIPEAMAGWAVETETVPTEGQDTEPRTSLVRWTGGPLEDGQLLEFGLRLRFPDEPGAVLEFPVVQRCGPDIVRAWTGADEAFSVPTLVLAERLNERDLIALSESVDELVAEVEDLRAQIRGVDSVNLRSRVADAESATQELAKRLDGLAERISVLEEAAEG